MSNAIQNGVYQHYKGKYYEVLNVAKHSETLEEMVIYRLLYDDFSMWLRPLKMFLENVEYAGSLQPRFKFFSHRNASEFLPDDTSNTL